MSPRNVVRLGFLWVVFLASFVVGLAVAGVRW